MSDGYVQVPADSVGKKIDATETYNQNQILVERQRVDVPGTVAVDGDVLRAILDELRVVSLVLAIGLQIPDSIESLRNTVRADDYTK